MTVSPVHFGAIWRVHGTEAQIAEVKQRLGERAGDAVHFKDQGGFQNAVQDSFNVDVITGDDAPWYAADEGKRQAMGGLLEAFSSFWYSKKRQALKRQTEILPGELDKLLEKVAGQGGTPTAEDAKTFISLCRRFRDASMGATPDLVGFYTQISPFEREYRERSRGGERLEAADVLEALQPDSAKQLDVETGTLSLKA